MLKTCKTCRTVFKANKSSVRCCSRSCGQILRAKLTGAGRATVHCTECGKKFQAWPSAKREFCSRSCLAKNKLKRPEIVAALYSEETREKISDGLRRFRKTRAGRMQTKRDSIRMTEANADPVKKKRATARMMRTKRELGTLHIWSGERGGNGTLTSPQEALLAALGKKWKSEVVVKTLLPRPPYPRAYKIDIGRKDIKLGIEVDGKSHRTKKGILLDAKKTRVLLRRGWRVLRFTNEDVTTRLSWVLSEIKTAVAATSSSTTSKSKGTIRIM